MSQPSSPSSSAAVRNRAREEDEEEKEEESIHHRCTQKGIRDRWCCHCGGPSQVPNRIDPRPQLAASHHVPESRVSECMPRRCPADHGLARWLVTADGSLLGGRDDDEYLHTLSETAVASVIPRRPDHLKDSQLLVETASGTALVTPANNSSGSSSSSSSNSSSSSAAAAVTAKKAGKEGKGEGNRVAVPSAKRRKSQPVETASGTALVTPGNSSSGYSSSRGSSSTSGSISNSSSAAAAVITVTSKKAEKKGKGKGNRTRPESSEGNSLS